MLPPNGGSQADVFHTAAPARAIRELRPTQYVLEFSNEFGEMTSAKRPSRQATRTRADEVSARPVNPETRTLGSTTAEITQRRVRGASPEVHQPQVAWPRLRKAGQRSVRIRRRGRRGRSQALVPQRPRRWTHVVSHRRRGRGQFNQRRGACSVPWAHGPRLTLVGSRFGTAPRGHGSGAAVKR